jgi:hypothetical protein
LVSTQAQTGAGTERASLWGDAPYPVLVADAQGAVVRSFVGEPTATDLWAALAELREPGTVPPSCTHD